MRKALSLALLLTGCPDRSDGGLEKDITPIAQSSIVETLYNVDVEGKNYSVIRRTSEQDFGCSQIFPKGVEVPVDIDRSMQIYYEACLESVGRNYEIANIPEVQSVLEQVEPLEEVVKVAEKEEVVARSEKEYYSVESRQGFLYRVLNVDGECLIEASYTLGNDAPTEERPRGINTRLMREFFACEKELRETF